MSISPGQRPTAGQLNDLGSILESKSADETINNSTTLQNDNELIVAVEANCDYLCWIHLSYTTGTTPDFKISLTYPAAASLLAWNAFYVNTGGAFGYSAGVTFPFSIGTTGSNPTPLDMQGLLRTGASAGSLTVQWAQNTATVSDTTVHNGSWIQIQKVR